MYKMLLFLLIPVLCLSQIKSPTEISGLQWGFDFRHWVESAADDSVNKWTSIVGTSYVDTNGVGASLGHMHWDKKGIMNWNMHSSVDDPTLVFSSQQNIGVDSTHGNKTFVWCVEHSDNSSVSYFGRNSSTDYVQLVDHNTIDIRTGDGHFYFNGGSGVFTPDVTRVFYFMTDTTTTPDSMFLYYNTNLIAGLQAGADSCNITQVLTDYGGTQQSNDSVYVQFFGLWNKLLSSTERTNLYNYLIDQTRAFYVDPDGSDNADGQSPDSAKATFASLTDINNIRFLTDDQILLQKDETYPDSLVIPEDSITVGTYGSGGRPRLKYIINEKSGITISNCIYLNGWTWDTSICLDDSVAQERWNKARNIRFKKAW